VRSRFPLPFFFPSLAGVCLFLEVFPTQIDIPLFRLSPLFSFFSPTDQLYVSCLSSGLPPNLSPPLALTSPVFPRLPQTSLLSVFRPRCGSLSRCQLCRRLRFHTTTLFPPPPPFPLQIRVGLPPPIRSFPALTVQSSAQRCPYRPRFLSSPSLKKVLSSAKQHPRCKGPRPVRSLTFVRFFPPLLKPNKAAACGFPNFCVVRAVETVTPSTVFRNPRLGSRLFYEDVFRSLPLCDTCHSPPPHVLSRTLVFLLSYFVAPRPAGTPQE